MPERMPQLRSRVSCRHEHDELAWACAGSVGIEIDGRVHRVDTRRTLWIPAGTEHTVVPEPGALVFPILFRPTATPPAVEPAGARRTPVLDRLAELLLQPGLANDEELGLARRRILDLLPRLIEAMATPPLPRDPRALEVAEALLGAPALPFSLDEWAQRVHASSKTLQRSFIADTAMSFPEWRTAVRLGAALPLLEAGETVAAVAARVGYASTGGFITAFRRRYGHTPGRHRHAA